MSESVASSDPKGDRPTRGRKIVAAALLLLLTFAAGVAVGVVGDRIALLRSHRVIPKGHAKFVSGKVLHALTRKLDLTPVQQTQVREILDRRSDAIERAAAALEPKVREEMKAAHIEIERVLTPEQKEKLRRMHARWND